MRRTGLAWVLVLGFAFLYLPIFLVMIYSFNGSRLVTVWGGWSLRWYGALLENGQMLDAAWLSLRVAAISASLATVLGTVCGYAMDRFGRFRGRVVLEGLLAAPLVMPEIVTGLSLLLLLVALERWAWWPLERGFVTIVIGHVTLSMAYVAVVIRARLAAMDRSVEEAAMDLGARPAQVFRRITLPLIAPAVAAGWLLAFTLSLDDVVLASFTSGPGGTTLPMVVFSSVHLGVNPQINALATLVVLGVSVVVLAAGVLLARRP